MDTLKEMQQFADHYARNGMNEQQVTALLYSCFKDKSNYREIGAVVKGIYAET